MRTVSIRLCDMEKANIPIGFVGENLYTQVRIDSKKVFDDYPTAIASLTIVNPHGDVYPGFITRDGDVIIWTVENSDLVYGGNGKIQLAFLVDDVVAKSYECRTYVSKALVSPTNIPTPIASWIDAANVVLGEAEEVFEALDEMTVVAETLAAGTSATAEISDVDGHKHIAFGIPKGDKGDQGNPGVDGSDGYSPTLVVSTITGGHRITITDKNGTSTVDIMDGEKGDTGATGNGISSVVLNQDYTLTINYTNGQSYTTTSIRGAKGDTGATGATGATPVISIGTVTTGDPDDPASATMDTTDPAHPVLSMVIPQGQPGSVPIDDTSTAADKVWSAQKTSSEVDGLKSAIEQSKAPVILDTATGEIVTVPDGADGMKVKTLTVAIEPNQDLHGQANPYPAGGGKNLFKTPYSNSSGTVLGITATVNDDGSVKFNGTSSGDYYFVFRSSNDKLPISAGTYTISINEMPQYCALYIAGTSLNNGTRVRQVTISENAEWTAYINIPPSAGNINFTLKIQIESGSTATAWSPYSNLCPISGWSAAEVVHTAYGLPSNTKNLLPAGEAKEVTVFGVTIKSDGKGTYSIKGTPTSSVYVEFALDGVYKLPTTSTYKMFFNNSQAANVHFRLLKDGNVVVYYNLQTKNRVFNNFPDENLGAEYNQIGFGIYYGQTVDFTVKPMITVATETDATFVPFGELHTYTFPAGAGTVYGGTLTVNADGTGKLVVDRKMITDFTGLVANGTSSTGAYRYKLEDSTLAGYGEGTAISNLLEFKAEFNGKANTFYNGTSVINIFLAQSTLETAKTFLSDNSAHVVCPLTTPVTYTLTVEAVSLLLGVNNIWADCGNVTMQYPCDTKLFIERLTAPSEDDMIANANITSGKFFMVGNNLYISTSAIAQGETITPGTNCTAVSLADALNQINQ